MTSRLLLLATHPREAASTRARLLAYEPALRVEGFEVSIQTFFPSESLPTLYADGQWIRQGRWVAAGAWGRWQTLRRASYDAVVIHRELFPWGMPWGTALFLSRLRRSKRCLIYDFDDAVYLPHRQDRMFIRCLEDPASVARLIAASDGVIAGNRHLAGYAARLNRRVECIPTPVDTSRLYPARDNQSRALCTIGWIGSPSTAKYLSSLAPMLEQLATTHRFQLKVVGAGEPVTVRHIHVDNRRWSLAGEADEFRHCDIGLYPLWDDEWSRGKCGFKALQFMASGVPVVASAIGMNTEIIADGVNGLLAHTPEEWLAQLRRLLDDASLRRHMGEAARQTVEERYALARLAPKFVSTIQTILNAREQACARVLQRPSMDRPTTEHRLPGPVKRGITMSTPQDILCFSSIDWDFIWQGHQEVMVRFARAGHRVLFIENTGARMPRLRDLSRVRQRWRNWRHGIQGIRKVEEGLYVYAPVILPFPYARAARWLNRWLMSLTLRSWMRAVGFKQPIAWVFLPTPLTLELLHELDPILTVYYCIDSFAASSPAAKKMAWAETQIIRRADLVFVTSQALRVYCEPWNTRVYEFPFGVNLQLFDEIAKSRAPLPADLAALPRPRVGYVGGIHQWVDQDLLRLLAQRHRDCSFVLIGPAQTDVSSLSGLPNLHLLGAKPHQELPRYIQGFDVCLIPYQLTKYTQHVYPTKLNEYFALGRPVVSTALPEVIRVAQRAQESVLIGREPEEFSGHVSRLLAAGAPHGTEQRRSIAEENSWTRKVEHMSQLIEERMTQRSLEQDSRWAERLLAPQQIVLRRLGRVAVMIGLVYGLLFHSPLVWWAAAPLKIVQTPVAADAIVVFAGGMGESGKAGQGYEERVQQAADLYREGYARRMLLVSGYVYAMQEANLMQALAVALGVPADAIGTETHGANTYQSVVQAARRLQAWDAHRILFVSSAYHMRRALLVWRSQAPDIQVVCTPRSVSSFYGNGRRVKIRHLHAIAHEYASLLYYRWRGYWR